MESVPSREKIDVRGADVLQEVKERNAHGQYAVFAPNHLTPQNSTICKILDMPDDYAALQRVLAEHELSARVVTKGDTHLPLGMMYNLHRTVFTKLAQWMTGGGIAVSANSKAPQGAIVRQNAAPVREMIRTLQGDSNLVMYPYGAHWKNVGEETFEESAALGPDGNFVDRNDPKWRDSLKDGFIRIAANAGALVVPVYVTFEEGQWKVSFGTPLAPEKKGDHIGVAKQYLEEMRQLKEGVSQS